MFFQTVNLDALVGEDHLARLLWRLVGTLDLSAFLSPIEAREGAPGRDATDPKILVTLWCYAICDAVGSARELARLCESHDAYRWICGGVSLNYHTLSDFRVAHSEALEKLFSEVTTLLLRKGLASVERCAQDGTRVRASAGTSSFRREPSLNKCREAAREQLEQAKKLAEDPGLSAAQKKAQARAALEREARIEEALKELPKVREIKKSVEKKEQARVSTTDPEARVMKMANGGFSPAYNVQLATTTQGGVIVGVDVTNVGSDAEQMKPMLEQIEERTGQRPKEMLVDGGYDSLDVLDEAAGKGTKTYKPPRTPKNGVPISYEPHPGDTEAIAEWRARMGTEEAKEIYKERASTAEYVNAALKERQGLKLRVRGLKKVLAVVLWHALAYNLTRWIALTS